MIFLGIVFKSDSAPNLKEQVKQTGDMVNYFVAENKSRYKVVQNMYSLLFCVFKAWFTLKDLFDHWQLFTSIRNYVCLLDMDVWMGFMVPNRP